MKNYSKSIIFALLIVTILFLSTTTATAKETKLAVRSADSSADRVAIYSTFAPETIEVNAGENVTWVNLKRPKGLVVLVSDDKLWEDTTLYYGKTLTYTFKEPGTYVFTLKDNPGIKGTVKVYAPDQKKKGSEKITGDVIVKTPQVTEETSSLNSEKSNKSINNERKVQNEEKILIYSTNFSPESMEIKKGDTVTWVNLKRPKGPSVLISDDGLWKDTTLYYGKAFSYTFEKTGAYTFNLGGIPEARSTVIVT